MAKSPSEQIRELSVEVGILRERDATRSRELDRLTNDLKVEGNARQRLEVEVAALKQQLQDHIKHTELSDTRRWSLILALFGALSALASGLIVTLVHK